MRTRRERQVLPDSPVFEPNTRMLSADLAKRLPGRLGRYPLLAMLSGFVNAGAFDCSSAFYLQWIGNPGRIQDEEPSPMNPVDSIIKYHDKCIPYLINKVADTSDGPMAKPCCFSRDQKGQIALLYLVDLFTKPDGLTPSIPEFSIRRISGTEARVLPPGEKVKIFRKAKNKVRLRRSLMTAYARDKDRIVFDEKQNCFVMRDDEGERTSVSKPPSPRATSP